MRILVITNRFPRPAQPTVATYNLVQAQAIAKHHEVRVIAPVPWPEEVSDLRAGRFPVREHTSFGGLRVYHPSVIYVPRLFEHRFGQQYLWSIRRVVKRVVAELRPTALFCCWAHPDGWACVQIARELGIPIIIKVIGSDVLVATKNPRRRKLIADALSSADGVVAVGEDLAKHVVALGVDARRVSVVAEGVDKDVFRPGDQGEARKKLGIPAAEKTILFVGNILVTKGIKALVEACSILKKEGRTFHCRVVGQGKDRPAMEALVLALGLASDVTFHGSCAHRNLGDWYRACDFLTLPSYSEGIPNVLREVELCGRPYIATNVGGIPEIAKPDVSRLVDPGDVVALARHMGEFLDSPPRVDPAKADARHISPAVSGQMVVDRFQAIFEERAAKPN